MSNSQVNYVINGGFDFVNNCNDPYPGYIIFSPPWDTLKAGGGHANIINACYTQTSGVSVPSNLSGGGYQMPRTGDGYAYLLYLKYTSNTAVNWRGYTQQKMTQKLAGGKSYCVTYWANLINYVNYAVDELGAYFDDGSLQSIGHLKEAPASPQVKSPTGVFYMDTLNWMKVQGTFIANGTEEYITIGNFRYTAATTFTALDGNNTAGLASYFIDDVSVIETDLPAYAGADVWGIPSTTVYLGRASEVGLDDDCFWYKLPNIATPIDTAAGIVVTVAAGTETYIVKQDICGNVKWDTVVVYASGVGINELKINNERLKIYPQPANEQLIVEIENGISEEQFQLKIINNLGELIREEQVSFRNKTLTIKTDELKNGIYFLSLRSDKHGTVNKKFVISH